MNIGSFSPILGTLGNDPLFDPIFIEDPLLETPLVRDDDSNLRAGNLEIVYGLLGDDNLALDSSLTADNVAILVGGSGSDRYSIENNQFGIILDNGNSNNDTLVATGITTSSSQALTIDARHLYIFDLSSDTHLLLLDYQDPENQIESFETADVTFTNAEIIANLETDPQFLGDFTLEAVQNNSNIPEVARLDLESIGLSSETFDTDIQKIKDTDNDFETTITFTENNIDGSLSNSDRSYIFNDETYFYDLYSLDSSTFGSEDVIHLNLTAEDFNPLLFVLDSRGNVIEFDRANEDDNSAGVAFSMNSRSPLFLAIESSDSSTTGNYELSVEAVGQNSTFIDLTSPIVTFDVLAPGDIANGSITSEDITLARALQDRYFLNTQGVGESISVTLEADFDGASVRINVFDSNLDFDTTRSFDEVEYQELDGLQQATFNPEAGFNYFVSVEDFGISGGSDYTLSVI